MNNSNVKHDGHHNNPTKGSLRGEAPQKHGVKRNKARKQNPETAAAQQALIAMSQEAQDMMEMAENGLTLARFKHCEKVNDFLIVMHQQASECKTFKTFHDWKKAGFNVKKGAKSYRVWGSPLKADKKNNTEQTTADNDANEDAADTFKYWPMCSLFNESQVELIDTGDDEKGDTEQSPGKTSQTKSKGDKLNQATHHTQDMGNNESIARGLFATADSDYVAMNFSESKTVETHTGAAIWLAARGWDTTGQPLTQAASDPDDTSESSPFVTSDYQEQQEARKDRMLARADKAAADSQSTLSRAKNMAGVIPFGQPILVGHHSEHRDRRYRNKIHDTFGKAFALDSKAEHYREKAARIGNNGIASNEPGAIEKLKAKLVSLQQSQKTMKMVNKIIRNKALSDDEKATEIHEAGLLTKDQAAEIVKPDVCGRIGFAAYALTNNNAEINRIKKRISTQEQLRNSEPINFENDDFSMIMDNGRIGIKFSGGKPSDEVRAKLKGSAFKWSRYQAAWVRKATANGVAEAQRLLAQLKALADIY